MAEGSYEIGYGKPPRKNRFKAGQSGNARGRPRGAKNFATAIDDELRATIIITENGKQKRIPKRQVIAKLLVNKAASGDLKAMPLLFNESRPHERQSVDGIAVELFGQAEDQQVIDSIVRRICAAQPDRSAVMPSLDLPSGSEEEPEPQNESP